MKFKIKRECGFKQTPQRLAILDYLKGNSDHPSAEDIYRAMKEKFPTMSFATIYNTLETFRQQGTVTELTIDPQRKRFDTNTVPHHHLICIKCKQIVDIPTEYPLDIPEDRKMGFEIVGNHIEFYGICPGCNLKKKKTSGVET
jgi:Fur family peroxide stress response transcriptional regulator